MKKIVTLGRALNGTINGTGKERRGRKQYLRNRGFDTVDVEFESFLSVGETDSDVICFEYLRGNPPSKQKLDREVWVRAHHLELFHVVENMICRWRINWRFRFFGRHDLKCTLIDLMHILKRFYYEFIWVKFADKLLVVSLRDAYIYRLFARKKVYYCPVLPVTFCEFSQLCLRFGSDKIVNDGFNIIYIGAPEPAPNVEFSFLEFNEFKKIFAPRKFTYSFTGNYPILKRIGKRSRLGNGNRGLLFDGLVDVSDKFPQNLGQFDFCFFGSLLGRGFKTKILDALQCELGMIFTKEGYRRFLYYEIEHEYFVMAGYWFVSAGSFDHTVKIYRRHWDQLIDG